MFCLGGIVGFFLFLLNKQNQTLPQTTIPENLKIATSHSTHNENIISNFYFLCSEKTIINDEKKYDYLNLYYEQKNQKTKEKLVQQWNDGFVFKSSSNYDFILYPFFGTNKENLVQISRDKFGNTIKNFIMRTTKIKNEQRFSISNIEKIKVSFIKSLNQKKETWGYNVYYFAIFKQNEECPSQEEMSEVSATIRETLAAIQQDESFNSDNC